VFPYILVKGEINLKKNRSIEIGLSFGIVAFFIILALTPMTLGHNAITSEQKTMAEKYSFDRYDCLRDYNYYNISKIYNRIPANTAGEPTYYNIKSVRVSNISRSSQPLDGPMNSSWPLSCHDIHHTGRSTHSTADNTGTEKWRFSDGHWIEINPAIDSNGVIYICDCWGVVTALYPNATMRWKFTAEGQIMGSSPAIAEDGTIYVGSWDCYLYAINPNGTLKWTVGTGGSIASSPAIANDGTIYVGNYGGKIVAVNPNGTIKWYYNIEDDITSDPAIGDDGTIYIGSLDSYLYALYPNGTLRWKFKTGDRIYGSPSIAEDGTIYIGSSWDSYLYALYPNGTLRWKYGGAGTPNNPSIGSDGTIYAGYLYNLVALYPDGSLKWNFYVGNVGYIGKSAPAISADGTIYFGIHLGTPGYSNGGEIIAVNPDGTEKWRKRIADYWVDSSPSIAEDGTVYIGSSVDMSRGYLHAFGNIESNSPPNTPSISGPSQVKVGEKHWYIFTAVDPDNNPIQLFVDWGDSSSDWVGEYASEEQIWVEHEWSTRGTYQVKAKVKDVMGEESGWGYLEVTVPRVKISSISPFLRLLEQHPNMFPILRYILLNQ